MRTMLCLASLAALLPTTDTRACGPVAPSVLALASHGSDHGSRGFIRLDLAVPANVTWQPLWRMSYDNTQIAPAPRRETPMQLTLVGNAGVRAVKTANQVFLREAWGHTTPTVALDLGNTDGFQIAVEGEHDGLGWAGLEYKASDTPIPQAWLDAQGIAANRYSAATLAGTTMQVVIAYGDHESRTILRDGDRVVAQATGNPLGVLTADGMRYLVTETSSGLVVRPI